MQKTPVRLAAQPNGESAPQCGRPADAREVSVASVAVPRQPEWLSVHTGAASQLTAASGQRRTSTERLLKRKYPRMIGSSRRVVPAVEQLEPDGQTPQATPLPSMRSKYPGLHKQSSTLVEASPVVIECSGHLVQAL